MEFRPCIDLRNGKVTQIVGSTLVDDAKTDTKQRSNGTSRDDAVSTNFVTEKSSSHYAKMYKQDELRGGHVIMLGKGNETAALSALQVCAHACSRASLFSFGCRPWCHPLTALRDTWASLLSSSGQGIEMSAASVHHAGYQYSSINTHNIHSGTYTYSIHSSIYICTIYSSI